MLRSASRLHVWLMILAVAAGISFYLLWLALNDGQVVEDHGGTGTVPEVSTTETTHYARRRRFRRSVEAPTPRPLRRSTTTNVTSRTNSSSGARRPSAPVPGV